MRTFLAFFILPTMALAQTLPSNLPEYGSRTESSIRVAVFGYAILHPGWYFLPKGAAVQDVAIAAKVRGTLGWDPAYSSIKRHKADGSVEKIRFKGMAPTIAEKIPLQEGDILCLSHEVY